jgi:E3 ubiquitin-protein ligase HUWE1
MLQAPREGPLARGILPTSDTINIIPQAFGAICLNNNGMKMFQSSKALESFFEIFESPEHVKCMDSNKDLPSNLGSTFDELVRHHPPLKTAIMNAILDMVARVGYLCKTKAEANKLGAVLRTYDPSGKPVVADAAIKASRPSKGKEKAADDGGDVEMQDVDTAVTEDTPAQPENPPNAPPMTAYVAAVATFLSAMFSNTSVRSDFCSRGGIEYVLDLAESPCLTYDFADGSASRVLQSVIALLAEQKPHLTMPSLLQRAQSAVDVLAPFANYQESGPFFKPFVNREAQQSAEIELLANGTGFVKALVNIHSLVSALRACFQTWAFNHRSASNGFNQLNLGDYYVRLVRSLGPLLGASFREEFELNKVVPDYYKSAARVKDSAFDDPVFAELLGGPEVPSPVAEPSNAEPGSAEQPAGNTATSAAANPPVSSDNKPKSMTKAERDGPEFKNFQALQYLLSKMSDTISPFFQILGKGLVNKRGGTDGFQKQSHAAIADALAETILRELAPRGQESSIENISHWIGMLHVLKDILVDGKQSNASKARILTYYSFTS